MTFQSPTSPPGNIRSWGTSMKRQGQPAVVINSGEVAPKDDKCRLWKNDYDQIMDSTKAFKKEKVFLKTVPKENQYFKIKFRPINVWLYYHLEPAVYRDIECDSPRCRVLHLYWLQKYFSFPYDLISITDALQQFARVLGADATGNLTLFRTLWKELPAGLGFISYGRKTSRLKIDTCSGDLVAWDVWKHWVTVCGNEVSYRSDFSFTTHWCEINN